MDIYLLILRFLSPSGQFGLMSDDLPKVENGNFLKHLHHFCISDDQGFAAEEKLGETSSYLEYCLSKQLFIEKQKVTGQNVDIYLQNTKKLCQKQILA
jgi:hypothetical protein